MTGLSILFVVPSYKPAYVYGGPIRSIAALCEALSRYGHHVTVFTTTANGEEELEVDAGREYIVDGVRVFYFRRLTKGHSNYSHSLIKAMLRASGQFEVIHIQSWWNLVTIPIAWICIMKGITPVISPRGTLTAYTFAHGKNRVKSLFHRILGMKLLNQSTLVFTSGREKDEALRYVDGKRAYVIHNLLALPGKIHGLHQDTPYLKLIFLGRIDPAKNLERLISALSIVKELPFELIIAGEGVPLYTQQLQQQTAGMPSIQWIGPIDGESKYKRLAEADLLVLPSHTENFGNVVFEALSQGTPVMVSDQVGAKDYVLEKNLGWVVAGDAIEWKEALTQAWKDKARRDDMRRRAPACIATDFDQDVQVKVYTDMYMDHIKHFSGR